MSQFQAFAITVRPQNGFQEETEKAFLKWFEKQHGAFAVIEKEGVERHLHAQLFYETPKSKGDINKQLNRICSRTIPDWSPAEERVLKRGTKIAYNDDYMDEYLAKEDNIIFNNPPENTKEYYPSEEEQQKVKASSNAVDKRYHAWSVDFKESKFWQGEDWLPALADTAKFLAYQMFVSKKYPIITEHRKKVEYTKNLHMYVCEKISIEEFMTQEDFAKHIAFLELKMA